MSHSLGSRSADDGRSCKKIVPWYVVVSDGLIKFSTLLKYTHIYYCTKISILYTTTMDVSKLWILKRQSQSCVSYDLCTIQNIDCQISRTCCVVYGNIMYHLFYCFVSWHIGCPLCMISPSPLFLHFLSITWHPGEFSPVSARHHLIGRSDRLHRARLCQNSAALLQAIWQIPMTCFDMKI